MTTTTPQPLVSDERSSRRSLNVFISCSTSDRYFAPLLEDLLEVHGHTVFLAPEDISAGRPLPDAIEAHLRSSDALVVLVSPGAVASKWVPSEVTLFETVNEGAPLIPLVLEETDLDQVCPELSRHQAVFLRPCMREGLRSLFRAFGNDFLSVEELRARRRGGEGRIAAHARSGRDRRTAPLQTRLYVGFQVTYTKEAGEDVCTPTRLSPETAARLIEALEPEASRYEFRDSATGRTVPPCDALAAAMPVVCEKLAIHSPPAAMVVFRELAAALVSMFDVSMIDRRDGQRHAGQERKPSATTA